MHFGFHLLDRGLITADELVRGLQVQQAFLPRLGQLAIEEGLMSVRDVFRVLKAQSDSTHEPFGKTAVSMGLLTRRDVAELLMAQSDRKRPLGEVLVQIGAISRETHDREWAAYRSDREKFGTRRAAPITRQVVALPVVASTADEATASSVSKQVARELELV